MFSIGEFERINNDYKVLQQTKRKKLVKVWGMLFGITIFLIFIFIILFPQQFSNEETQWILPVYGGSAFLCTLIGLLISSNYQSEKPIYKFIFNEIIEKINIDESIFLNYKAYDKEDRGFNKIGGLFTRHASVRVKRHITGNDEEQNHFNIYDCIMTTSSGNSSTTHFYGVYFVLNRNLNTSIQIRTTGSPKLKGVKFNRRDEFEGLRVYKEVEQSMTNIDHNLLAYMNRLAENEEYKRVYLSVVDGQIHLALWYKKNPLGKDKTMTVEVLNRLLSYFLSEYKMIESLSAIDNF